MPSEMKQPKLLERENARLKRSSWLTSRPRQNVMLQGCRSAKALKPARGPAAGRLLMDRLPDQHFGAPCRAFPLDRSTYHSQAPPSRAGTSPSPQAHPPSLAETRVRYGHRRIHILLRREGWTINHKRTGVCIARRACNCAGKPRSRRYRRSGGRIASWLRPPMIVGRWTPVGPAVRRPEDPRAEHRRQLHTVGAGDPCAAELLGRRCRRNAATCGADLRPTEAHQGRQWTGVRLSKELDLWAYLNGVVLDFSRPGKPTDNARVCRGPSTVSSGAECLNASWFLSLNDARSKSEAWRMDYNEVRPHSHDRQPNPDRVGTHILGQSCPT